MHLEIRGFLCCKLFHSRILLFVLERFSKADFVGGLFVHVKVLISFSVWNWTYPWWNFLFEYWNENLILKKIVQKTINWDVKSKVSIEIRYNLQFGTLTTNYIIITDSLFIFMWNHYKKIFNWITSKQ